MKHNSKIIPPVIIEIRPSKLIKGEIGLFATRILKKNTIIALAKKLEERFFPWSKYKELDKITKNKVDNFTMQTEEGFYLPPDFNYLSVPWNMNHSCNYNVGFDKEGNFVTVKNIKAGEELLLDYGMFFSDPKFVMKCKCGSKSCRKVITGNDWKSDIYRNKNKDYFLRELLKKSIEIKK